MAASETFRYTNSTCSGNQTSGRRASMAAPASQMIQRPQTEIHTVWRSTSASASTRGSSRFHRVFAFFMGSSVGRAQRAGGPPSAHGRLIQSARIAAHNISPIWERQPDHKVHKLVCTHAHSFIHTYLCVKGIKNLSPREHRNSSRNCVQTKLDGGCGHILWFPSLMRRGHCVLKATDDSVVARIAYGVATKRQLTGPAVSAGPRPVAPSVPSKEDSICEASWTAPGRVGRLRYGDHMRRTSGESCNNCHG